MASEPSWLDALLAAPENDPGEAALEEVARNLSGAGRERIIRLQIEGCLDELVGGSGNLGRLLVVEGSFAIMGERSLDDGGVEVAFSARASLETESLPPEDDAPFPIEGRIGLDAALRTRAGPDGRTQLSPERTTVPPGTWTRAARGALRDLHAARLASASNAPAGPGKNES